jgi:uncharacterized protein DUF2784
VLGSRRWETGFAEIFDLPMLFRTAADLVVVVHAAFVVFVVLGGVLVARWPRAAWLHLPAVAWGIVVESAGWICPLTPLENYLRERGGSSAYRGEFIEHYLLPVLYPAQLTRTRQTWLGILAVVVNLCLYTYSSGRARRRRRSEPSRTTSSS